jgi:hypothetical protein
MRMIQEKRMPIPSEDRKPVDDLWSLEAVNKVV